MRSCGTPSTIALDAVAEQPVGVLAAAGEAPPAADPVAAVDGGDRAGGVERAGDDDVGTSAKSASNVARGQPGEVDTTRRRRSSRSSHRGVGAGQRLEDAHRVGRSAPRPPWLRGQQHPEAAGLDELVEQVARHPAGRLDLGGARRRSSGASSLHRVERRPARRRALIDGGHPGSPSRPQHRGLGGVAGPQLVVPAAVAVADDLGDPAVAHLAQPEPPGDHSSRRGRSPRARSRTRSRSGRCAASARSSRLGDRRAAARRTPPAPASWNRHNGGNRSKNASGANTSSSASKVSKQRLNARAQPLDGGVVGAAPCWVLVMVGSSSVGPRNATRAPAERTGSPGFTIAVGTGVVSSAPLSAVPSDQAVLVGVGGRRGPRRQRRAWRRCSAGGGRRCAR